jgi:hypothetical protein
MNCSGSHSLSRTGCPFDTHPVSNGQPPPSRPRTWLSPDASKMGSEVELPRLQIRTYVLYCTHDQSQTHSLSLRTGRGLG